jgi:hypothetical protein
MDPILGELPDDDDFSGPSKHYIVGLIDVEMGYETPYPVTVYAVAGDDTSGIVGLLMPSGEFIPKAGVVVTARFWEFDETLTYEKVLDADGQPVMQPNPWGDKPCNLTKANSWDEGEVLWNGRAGDIQPRQSMIAEVNTFTDEDELVKTVVRTEKKAVVVNRRLNDTNALTGDWITTGELWRAIERGTQMCGGPQAGRVHEIRDEAA